MFKNEPLWAVYAALKQHYTLLAGGKTNTASKLKLKERHDRCCPAVLLRVAVSCVMLSDKRAIWRVCKMEAFS